MTVCDSATLNWVGKEIEVALNDARTALESYVEGDHDPAHISIVNDRIHQVVGTLKLIELYGAAMFAEELGAVAGILGTARGELSLQACEALMSGLVALPDYLAALGNGGQDIPVGLLALMNDLRAVRDEPLLSETSLFAPGLESQLVADVEDGGEASEALLTEIGLHRRDLHLGLLAWYRGDEEAAQAGLDRLVSVISGFQSAAGTIRVTRLFEAIAAVVEGVRSGVIGGSVAVKRLIGGLDRLVKRILQSGEAGVAKDFPLDTIKNFLYYVATAAEPATPLIEALRSRYHLVSPVAAEPGAVEDVSIFGLSSDTLDKVRSLLLGDLVAIKDHLDLTMHAGQADAESLRQLVPRMYKFSDTLGMIGLGILRQRLFEHAADLESRLDAGEVPAEDALMGLAADLVFVESSLQGGALHRQSHEDVTAARDQGPTGLAPGELSRYRAAVLAEIAVELEPVKDAVSRCVVDPEQATDMAAAVDSLARTSGAFRIMDMGDAAQLADRIGQYIGRAVGDPATLCSGANAELLAEAIAGLEFYVELSGPCHAEAESVLEFAGSALDHLAALTADSAPEIVMTGPAVPDETTAGALPLSDDLGALPDGHEIADNRKTGRRLIVDEDIYSTFIDEAREQLEAMQQDFARWSVDADDSDALTGLRRGFHTLKGSGRMVGADTIGEFSWAIENLLNRFIEGRVTLADEVRHLLGRTLPVLEELVDAEVDGRMPLADVHSLAVEAFHLAGTEIPASLADLLPGSAVGPEATGPPAGEPLQIQDLEHETSFPTEDAFAAAEMDDEGLEADRPPVFELDTVLADIFQNESRTHLRAIDSFLGEIPESTGDLSVTDGIVRAFHTLHGSAQMAGVRPVAALSAAVERLLRALQSRTLPVDALTVSLLHGTSESIGQIVDMVNRPGATEPDWQPLCDDLDALLHEVERENEPAAEWPDDEEMDAGVDAGGAAETGIADEAVLTSVDEDAVTDEVATAPAAYDPELIPIFVEEQRDLLERLEDAFARWRNGESSALSDLQRVLHTLKGAARLTGLPQIGDLSHAFETMLNGLPVEEPPPSASVDLGRQACDSLMEQADLLESGMEIPAYADIVTQLESWASGVGSGGVAPPGEESSDDRHLTYLEPPSVVSGAAAASQGRTSGEAERIRMSTELLDRMVDNVGEVSIYAARLAQEQNRVAFDLRELEQTVERLSEQLRRMEIETEAQILYRHEREHDGKDVKSDFDPLELDRFSSIQELSRSLAETVDDLGNIRTDLQNGGRESETLLLQQNRIVMDLQNALMRTRLVPFTQQVSRLERLVRQTCTPLGKKARLIVHGRETELDRSVLDKTMPLLEHLLRNAVSHGIETPGERIAQGKGEEGRVILDIARDGMDVVLSVTDDGLGLDTEASHAKAVEQGLVDGGRRLAEEDIKTLVLLPGVSTAREVTQISGRGVGLDVVNSQVKQLGGTLAIKSREGQGATFTIRLPFTLAITDVLLVTVGDEVFAVPHTTVESVVRVPRERVEECRDGREPGFEYGGHIYPLRYFGQLFNEAVPLLPDTVKWLPALLVHAGDRRMALQVDALLGARRIVVKSLGPQLSVVPWLLGGTILGDGRVALIADVVSLVRAAAADLPAALAADEAALRQLTVMVVDDSITVRKVTSRLLERHNMSVVTAKDGAEAIAALQDVRPDVMLLDIEMPRMDGFEVARHVRNNPGTADMPIIMITSRTGEKHRDKAREIGVENYLGKPYQEDELMDAIFEVLAGVSE